VKRIWISFQTVVLGLLLLNEMTELTGGRAFSVENLNDLPDISAKIGAELRNQYILGYHPGNKAHDARWRKINIKLRAPKGTSASQRLRKDGRLRPQPIGLTNIWSVFALPRHARLVLKSSPQ
jgi:VWFA-related protein